MKFERFEKHLVLNKYFLKLFGFEELEKLLEKLKDNNEDYDSLDRSFFIDSIMGHSNSNFTGDQLLKYDRTIRVYVEKLRKNRRQPSFNLKYFQYLSILFTEIFLEKFFSYKEQFVSELNQFIEDFNSKNRTEISPFTEEELKKLAFWIATGGGKTLIMHINYWQILNYSRVDWDNIILITPNEGMSKQHFTEMKQSGVPCKLYDRNINNIKTKQEEVLIIDIHKLKFPGKKEGKGVTIDISYFDGKNLVFIDEGHKGQTSEERKWKRLREEIGKRGFIFEYSATFGQVIGKNKELLEEYRKSILFDYSYKHFYTDNYGKDFFVYNLKESLYTDKHTDLILTVNLLSYYEQLLIYEENKQKVKENRIEKPLWTFIGSKVTVEGSDVVKVVKFLKRVLEDKKFLEENTKKILGEKSGLVDEKGDDIFKGQLLQIRKKIDLKDLYGKVFNGQDNLELYEIKNADGEIGLKIRNKGYFGIINVGGLSSVKKLLSQKIDIEVNNDNFTDSLFFDINENGSSVNVLIGSKKFIEGWDSWRVSSMVLLNMGKGEGPQIIQLFGRGVRLKGKNFSLKRDENPDYPLRAMQTLFIFGLNANYMNIFLETIKREDVDYEELRIPVKLNRLDKWENKIYTFKTKEDFDFTETVLELTINKHILNRLRIDLTPKMEMAHGLKTEKVESIFEKPTYKFLDYITFVDWDEIYLELMNYKLSKGYFNLIIPKDFLVKIIESKGYKLFATEEQITINSFQEIKKIQKIILSILKTYLDRFYKNAEKKEIMNHLIVKPLDRNDVNIKKEIILKIPKEMVEEFKSFLKNVDNIIKKAKEGYIEITPIMIHFDKHLYTPLIVYRKGKEDIKSSPIKLNKGETDFVKHLRHYLVKNKEKLKEKQIFLLRNLSKVGIGFFQNSGFYPDFILWVKEKDKQKIIFVDPKGVRNLEGFEDDKVNFCTTYIKEIENKIKNLIKIPGELTLTAYIISITELSAIPWAVRRFKKEDFEKHNVLFLEEDGGYISQIFS